MPGAGPFRATRDFPGPSGLAGHPGAICAPDRAVQAREGNTRLPRTGVCFVKFRM